METVTCVIEGTLANERTRWLETWRAYPLNRPSDTGYSWSPIFQCATTWPSFAVATNWIAAHSPSGGFPGLEAVRVRSYDEVHRLGIMYLCQAVQKAVEENCGFLESRDLQILAAFEPNRQVLVRCSGCRFLTAASNAEHIIEALEKHYSGQGGRALDYCRDISLPTTDPAWSSSKTRRV